MTACNKDDDSDFVNQKAARAVMIYMAGENNLTSYGGNKYLKRDLQEILEGSKLLSNKQRLFLFIDSLGTNKNYKGTPYILEIHNGTIYERYRFNEDFYSCDPNLFHDIIGWMTSNIQADGYGIVLWGHASGWMVEPDTIAGSSHRAYGLDTNDDIGATAEKWMNITQMAKALEGLPKMDFIFADCCNMLCAETGYELRHATNYLIGSPAEIPGDGAPYKLMVPQLFNTGTALYRDIIDTYYDYYYEYYNSSEASDTQHLKGYSVPLGVIETKYMEQLAEKTHDIVTTFATDYPQTLDLNGIAYYAYIDAPLFYDMMGVIRKHTSTSDFNDWAATYRQAVPYYRMSMKWMTIYSPLRAAFPTFDQNAENYGCVSMFIPMNLSAYTQGKYRHNTTSNNFGWNRVIDWSRFGW